MPGPGGRQPSVHGIPLTKRAEGIQHDGSFLPATCTGQWGRLARGPFFERAFAMRQRPLLTPLVRSLPSTIPFVGPEAQERDRGRAFRARIGANESSFGPSPKVIRVMQDVAKDQWMYCDPDNHDLKTALAKHLGVRSENVVVGEGIDGLLNLAVRMLIEPGAPV